MDSEYQGKLIGVIGDEVGWTFTYSEHSKNKCRTQINNPSGCRS